MVVSRDQSARQMVLRDKTGRGERIRTSDLSVPNRAHYQAVLRPDPFCEGYIISPKRNAILASAGRSGQGLQETARTIQRLSSMTDSIFGAGIQLSESQIISVGNEYRIVTKSIGTARTESNPPLADAF